MEDTKITSVRRQEILDNLRIEREKRRDDIEIDEFDYESEISYGFRSETIARLVQERRNQDILEISKNNLQSNLNEEKNLRNGLLSKDSQDPNERNKSLDYQIDEKNLKVNRFSSPDLNYDPKVSGPRIREFRTPDLEDKPKKRELKNKKNSKNEKPPKNNVKEPKTTQISYSISASEREAKKENFDKRIDELLKLKQEKLKTREIEKRKKEEEELKNCSFTPHVTPYFNKLTSAEKIEDRLIKIGLEQQKNRDKIIKEKEKKELDSSKFTPKISENSSLMIRNRPPIYERVEELQKEKQEIINNLRNHLEAKSESNFKPRINSNSSKMIQNKFLTEETGSKDSKTFKTKLAEQLKQEMENFTFTPQTINKTGNLKGFLERQDEFIKKKEKHIQEKVTQEENCTFKPVINHNSRFMSQELPNEDKFERMGKAEHEKREQKKAKIQEDYYSKFTHEPRINPASKYIYKTQCPAETKQEVPENEENFSFKPKLETSKKFSDVKSHYSKPDQILHKIEERERLKQEKLLNIKLEYEKAETKDCTFAPKLSEMNENKEVILIHGLDRFLALKELSKKQEEEKKAREHKAFGIKGSNNLITVPKPFNLAPDNKEKKIEKLKQDMNEQIMKECTFKPKTLES